jgi:hypothetical protein
MNYFLFLVNEFYFSNHTPVPGLIVGRIIVVK